MAANGAHPVRTLSELITSLEAAITLTLADPKPRPVHHLRTATRRIEAQLELLTLLPGLPPHSKPARKSRKLLHKLRRAAGTVRDLDVLRELTPSKSRAASQLRSLFEDRRDRAAKKLIAAIRKHHDKLTRALKALLEALAPAEPQAIAATQIVQLTLDWYAQNVPSAATQDHRRLHDIRKAAKLARYIAESAASASTRRLAQAFQSLQQSGGNWHDWLTLSAIAHHELGGSSPLAQSFHRRCERSLAKYQSHLKVFPKDLTSP